MWREWLLLSEANRVFSPCLTNDVICCLACDTIYVPGVRVNSFVFTSTGCYVQLVRIQYVE